MPIAMMKRRKIAYTIPACRNCSLKYDISSDIWSDINSKSQLIAQSRLEVKAKQRASQFRLMAEDPAVYLEKRFSKSYVCGSIKEIIFDSIWELYYIAYCLESDLVESISRYAGSISYLDKVGVSRRYFPDFVFKYGDGTERIIEIKGSKKYNNFHDKFNAGRKKHGINYLVYEQKDLYCLGIKFNRGSFLIDFYIKNFKHIEFHSNKRVDNLMKRINEWLK